MKVQVSLLILLVLGVSCNEDPMKMMGGIQDVLKKWFGMTGRIMKFQKLFMQKAEEGIFSKDKLHTAFEKATEAGRNCYSESLTESKSVMKELADEIKSYFKSGNEAGGDVGNKHEAILKKVTDLYSKMSKMSENPELKEDIGQLANKFMEAFGQSEECFMNSLKQSLTPEEVDALHNLWDQSKQ